MEFAAREARGRLQAIRRAADLDGHHAGPAAGRGKPDRPGSRLVAGRRGKPADRPGPGNRPGKPRPANAGPRPAGPLGDRGRQLPLAQRPAAKLLRLHAPGRFPEPLCRCRCPDPGRGNRRHSRHPHLRSAGRRHLRTQGRRPGCAQQPLRSRRHPQQRAAGRGHHLPGLAGGGGPDGGDCGNRRPISAKWSA